MAASPSWKCSPGGFVSDSSPGDIDAELTCEEQIARRLKSYRSTEAIFHKYHFGSALGVGSHGLVRELTDKKTGVKYACKEIRTAESYAADDDTLQHGDGSNGAGQRTSLTRLRALEEIHAMCDLQHPGVARLVEYYENSYAIYIVMELVTGRELTQELAGDARGPLPEEHARDLFRQLLKAVQYMHAQGVIHRDLKPDNVVILTDGPSTRPQAKVVDFGLAYRAANSKCLDGVRLAQCCGSPAFVAPEVLWAQHDPSTDTGGRYYGKECDVWSLGVILFYMLSGYLPFEGHTMSELITRVAHAVYNFTDPAWGHVSEEAIDLVGGLLEPEPVLRLTIDEALQHPWLLEE